MFIGFVNAQGESFKSIDGLRSGIVDFRKQSHNTIAIFKKPMNFIVLSCFFEENR